MAVIWIRERIANSKRRDGKQRLEGRESNRESILRRVKAAVRSWFIEFRTA
jgi:hypothetical protein